MRIILLSGPSGCGKTTTFHELYDQLTQGANPLPSKQMDGKDFECVLSYNGKTVALHSHGDVMKRVVKAIVKYSHVDCLITAFSVDASKPDKMEFFSTVGSYHQPPQSHGVQVKTLAQAANQQAAANAQDAAAIAAMI